MDDDPLAERQEFHSTRVVTGWEGQRPGPEDVARRIVIFLFGLIQLVLVLRIVLRLLDADPANRIVSTILDVSSFFATPFQGILQADTVHSGGSVLDVAAILALIGWTILEVVVLAGIRLMRTQET